MEFDIRAQVFCLSKKLELGVSKKLKQHWLGPFRVLKRIGSNAYELELGGRFKGIHPIFHVSLLKAHHPGGSVEGPPDPVVRDNELEYEVDRILGHRKRGNRFE